MVDTTDLDPQEVHRAQAHNPAADIPDSDLWRCTRCLHTKTWIWAHGCPHDLPCSASPLERITPDGDVDEGYMDRMYSSGRNTSWLDHKIPGWVYLTLAALAGMALGATSCHH